MIKIDGEKIKKLRESQGLTQLYMATAVQVTTDTISRWENKRYPSIKEENGEKLAEALGVTIDEILLTEEELDDNRPLPRDISRDEGELTTNKNQKFLVITFFTFIGIALLLGVWFLIPQNSTKTTISARRIMPEGVIPNSPFPVVIEINHPDNNALSVILKETLPPESKVLQTSPKAGGSPEKQVTKWIHKLQGSQRFSYLVTINDSPGKRFTFNGSVSTSMNSQTISVTGVNTVKLGAYHWADLDKDNKISDQEILTVFDYYSGIDDFTVDIEFIESMWLGSGYSWDSKSNSITVIP